uniref:Keratin 18a, tandem duplicate 2 n=1 Tax=Neogobius melanostomus TaxID=47308 RepID=A0A8C6WQZ1_9GOBI
MVSASSYMFSLVVHSLLHKLPQTMASPIKRQGFYSRSAGYSHSLPGGFMGHRTRISTVNSGYRFGSGMTADTFNYQPSGFIRSEKFTMQDLNERLATYMKAVSSLEAANHKLQVKIYEAEKKGPLEGRDNSKYKAIIADLKAKMMDKTKGNARLTLSLDNNHMMSDDFRVKLEYELSMRKVVEADMAQLRKLLDDNNVNTMQLESEVEALTEDRIVLEKEHNEDLEALRERFMQGRVRVDVDAPKGQDLADVMSEIRDKYEKITLKNQKELKTWHESKIKEVKVQVTESSTALKEATTMLSETKKKFPALEIKLQSALSLKESMEAHLRDIAMRNNMELSEHNAIILRLQEELSQIRSEMQHKTREYEHLESEIVVYRRLLGGEGEDLELEDTIGVKKVQTKVVTLTQTLVDGKVVSESKDIKEQEQEVVTD